MSGATVIFYGRRSRSSRTFDDLGFSTSSSSSSSSSSDRGGTQNHHRHRKSDLHRRCRRSHNLDELPRPRPPPVASEPQQGVMFDPPSRNISSRETSLSGRRSGHDRLPVPVLLAKERLLQRLRGVSISGSSSGGEAETSSGNDVRDVDTSSPSQDQSPLYNFSEWPPGATQQSASTNKKFSGLTEEAFSRLHHEIYLEPENSLGNSATSNDCSICLETFTQGNQLIGLGCGHRFHTECLYPWLQTCRDCPNCRSCISAATSCLE